jgi:hypothetical protein
MGLAHPRKGVRRMFEITDFPADVQEKFEKLEQEIAEGGNTLGQQ